MGARVSAVLSMCVNFDMVYLWIFYSHMRGPFIVLRSLLCHLIVESMICVFSILSLSLSCSGFVFFLVCTVKGRAQQWGSFNFNRAARLCICAHNNITMWLLFVKTVLFHTDLLLSHSHSYHTETICNENIPFVAACVFLLLCSVCFPFWSQQCPHPTALHGRRNISMIQKWWLLWKHFLLAFLFFLHLPECAWPGCRLLS